MSEKGKGKIEETVNPRKRYEDVLGMFSLKYLFEIIFRRKRIIVLPTILVAALSAGGSFLIPKAYMSSTTILVQNEEILNPLVRWEAAVSLSVSDKLSTFMKIIYSRTLLEQVVERLELAGPDPEPLLVDTMIGKLHSAIKTQQQGSDSFGIDVSYGDPVLAKEIAETVTELFIDKSLEGDRKEALIAVEFIQEQLDYYNDRLVDSEETLRKYKEDNPKQLPQQQNSYLADLEAFRSKLVEVEVAIKEKTLEGELFRKRLTGEAPMVISQATYIQHTPYQTEHQRLTILYQEMLQSKRPNHPDVVKIKCDLAAIKKMLDNEKENNEAAEKKEIMSPTYQEILARLQQCEIEIESRVLQKREYKKIVEDLETKVIKIPESEMRLSRLERDMAITRELTNTLRVKVEQARITQKVELQSQLNRFQILDPARVAFRHYKPNRMLIVIGGILGGFFLGFCLIFVFEFLDQSIVREEEIPHLFGEKVMSKIPKLFVREDLPWS